MARTAQRNGQDAVHSTQQGRRSNVCMVWERHSAIQQCSVGRVALYDSWTTIHHSNIMLRDCRTRAIKCASQLVTVSVGNREKVTSYEEDTFDGTARRTCLVRG